MSKSLRKMVLIFVLSMFLSSMPLGVRADVMHVEEADGSPSTWIWKLLFPSGSLTDNGDGTATYNGAGTITGNLTIGSTTAGKNLSVVATLGTELVTWTDAGWNEDGATWTFAASTLTHVTGNTTAVTATLGAAVVAGTTYRVSMTGTGGGATATYVLGGVTGTTIAASGAIAIEDYITAATTGSLIITPSNTCTVALTNVSVKALTNATGDVTVDGNLVVRSPVMVRGQILMTNGELLSPSISFENDPDTGLRWISSGSFGAVNNGVSGVRLISTGIYLPSNFNINWNDDTFLYRDGTANIIQLGIDAATPTAQTLKAADSTGAGNAGANLILSGGTGGAGGSAGTVDIGTTSAGRNLNVYGTLGANLSPAYSGASGVNWTVGAGWADPIVTALTANAGGTGTATPTAATAVVAGTTYKVVLTVTVTAGTCTYTLGGVTGTSITASTTITDYITASTTGNIIFTKGDTFRGTIIATWQALTDATGDTTVDGNLVVRSPATFNGKILVSDGTVAYPSIARALDPTTGFYINSNNGLWEYSVSGIRQIAFAQGIIDLLSDIGMYRIGTTSDLILTRDAANTLQLGTDAATATAQTIKAADSTGAGNAGADMTIKGGTPGTGGAYGKVKIANGSTGGIFRAVAEATASIEADTSTTITLAIPAGARLLGAQLRVDTALTATELWDAAFSGGSTTAIVTGAAVAKQTKVNKLIVDEITSDVTNIAITKNGGGSFTAAGVIHAWAYYEVLDTLADAP